MNSAAHVGARADLERTARSRASGRERDRLKAALVGAQEPRRAPAPAAFLAPAPRCGPRRGSPLEGQLASSTASPTASAQADDAVALHQGFPRRAVAAAAPPPCTRCPFAALTIASVFSASRLERTTEGRGPGYSSCAIIGAPRSASHSGTSSSFPSSAATQALVRPRPPRAGRRDAHLERFAATCPRRPRARSGSRVPT